MHGGRIDHHLGQRVDEAAQAGGSRPSGDDDFGAARCRWRSREQADERTNGGDTTEPKLRSSRLKAPRAALSDPTRAQGRSLSCSGLRERSGPTVVVEMRSNRNHPRRPRVSVRPRPRRSQYVGAHDESSRYVCESRAAERPQRSRAGPERRRQTRRPSARCCTRWMQRRVRWRGARK